MICRTQVAVQSTNSAMAALLMWPDESMTILALRLLTALRRCLFKRRSLTFSKGRKGRTLIVSFMMHLQVKVAKNSTWRCFTLLGAHQLSVTLPILPSRPYFNESCQLKTAVLSSYKNDRGVPSADLHRLCGEPHVQVHKRSGVWRRLLGMVRFRHRYNTGIKS